MDEFNNNIKLNAEVKIESFLKNVELENAGSSDEEESKPPIGATEY